MEHYEEYEREELEREERAERRKKEAEKADGEIKLYGIKDLLMILLVIVLLTVATIFAKRIYTYEMPVFDPIADLKTTIMNIEGMFVVCSAVFLFVSVLMRKNFKKVHSFVAAALIFSFLMTISLLGAKIYMDLSFDANKFIEFYNAEEYASQIRNVTLEEFVVGSRDGYENFTTKCTINLIINIAIIAIEARFFKRINEILRRQEKIRAHDAALFDTETNVKI